MSPALCIGGEGGNCLNEPCENCLFAVYDEEFAEYSCGALWEEDVAARYWQGQYKSCPYFRPGDDYTVV